MTSIALSSYGMTRRMQPVRTTAVVIDHPIRSRASRRGERSLADAVRAYYVTRFTMLAGVVTMAMMAGAFIGRL